MFRILFLSLLLLPLSLRAEAPKVPSDKAAKALALDSILAFNKAVQEKDFKSFHGQISNLWREQITPEKLATGFKPFIDKKIDLSNISEVEPAFDNPPALDGNGSLLLTGSYPTHPQKTLFELTYVWEKAEWKLIGVDVRTVPSVENRGKLPSNKELKSLALESLLAFNKAVQANDFTSFHGEIAELWQKQITPEEMQTLFKSWIDKGDKADISGIAKSQPIFDTPPAINADGVLILKGHYPTNPNALKFELKYLYEETAWKLVGIEINTY